MAQRKINYWICAICLFLVFSCDGNRIFEENKQIEGSAWDKNNIVSFSLNVTDKVTPQNVYINIRQNGQYENSNLYLFINIISPANDTLRDTVNCLLADATGKWLGSGLGDIYSNQILYKKNIRFPLTGNYIFQLQQAMRTDIVKNIEDVGIRIEKAQ